MQDSQAIPAADKSDRNGGDNRRDRYEMENDAANEVGITAGDDDGSCCASRPLRLRKCCTAEGSGGSHHHEQHHFLQYEKRLYLLQQLLHQFHQSMMYLDYQILDTF